MNNTRSFAHSISVNGRFLSQPITGVQRYAYELLTAIDVLLATGKLDAVPMTVLIPPDVTTFPSWSKIRLQRVGKFTGQAWEQLDLAFHARATLLFTPCGGAPLAHRRNVMTIHDAGPFRTPRSYTFMYRNYYKALQTVLARSASRLITVSEFSRQELSGCLGVSDKKISVTPLSGEHILRCDREPAVLSRHNLQRSRYVLGVASRNPNKNLRGLIEAAKYLDNTGLQLAIAGGSNSTIFETSPSAVHSVRDLGVVSDSALRTLYENAACFVFPSFYEGFGLPPLEALSLGCPVIASRAASLPEILGSAVTYCNPHSPEDIARQISRVAAGHHPSREEAVQHASAFTWESCARKTWSILRRELS